MKKWFLNIEFSVLGLVILGMIMKLLDVQFADLLLMISLLTLAFIYLLLGFSAGKNISPSISVFTNETTFTTIESFTLQVSGMSFSVMLVGILFQILHFEGSTFMLMIGVISSVIAMIAVYFVLRINQSIIYNFIFFRQLPITFMAGTLLYLGDKMNIF